MSGPAARVLSIADIARERLAKRAASAAPEPSSPAAAQPVVKRTLAEFLEKEARTFDEFCSFLKVVPKEAAAGGSGPVPFKRNLVQRRRALARTPYDIVCKARQQGITTDELTRDLFHWLTVPNAAVSVMCQSAQDHKPLNTICKSFGDLLRSLEEDAGVVLPWRAKPTTSHFVLQNGNELTIGEAGASAKAASKKGRAGRLTRLHATEFAYWEYAGETWNAILECLPLAGSTEIVIESTPNGSAPNVARDKRDIKHATGAALFHWLYQDAKEGKNGFRAHFFPWFLTEEYAAPIPEGTAFEPDGEEEAWLVANGVSPEQIQWRRLKRQNKDADTFAQEYPKDDATCFLISGRTFFDKGVTAALFLAVASPIQTVAIRGSGAHGEVRFFAAPIQGLAYVIAADTSEGSGGDPCAAQVYEQATLRHMATLDGQLKPIVFARWLAWLGQAFGWCRVAVERNNHGHAVLLALQEVEHYPNIFTDRDDKPGWLTHEVTRTPALDKVEEAHRTGIWKTFDQVILDQFRTFVVNDRGKAEAAHGAHDEHPICAAIGLDVLTRPGVARGVGQTPILPF